MDEIKKPEEQVKAAPQELTAADLEKVAGGGSGSVAGKVDVSDISVIKPIDKATPTF